MKKRFLNYLKLITLLFGNILSFACSGNFTPLMSYISFSALPPVIVALGQEFLLEKAFIQDSIECTNTELIAVIQEVFEEMGLNSKAISIKKWVCHQEVSKPPFMVVKDTLVIINESWAQKLEREALRGIIAHEAAHLYNKDLKIFRYQSIVLIIPIHLSCRLAASCLGIPYSLTGTTGLLEFFINQIMMILNHRRREKRADLTVAELLPNAIPGLIKALQYYRIIANGDQYSDLKHPLLSTRIAYLQKELQRLSPTPA